MRFALTLCVLSLTFAACRKAGETDSTRDEYGCLYPERYLSQETPGPDPEDLRLYESCNVHARFHLGCLGIGGQELGGICRRIRDGKAEYTAPTEYTRSFGFTDAWWIDCKPGVLHPVEPGDPLECYGLEPDADPASVPWECVVQPPAWCPPNP